MTGWSNDVTSTWISVFGVMLLHNFLPVVAIAMAYITKGKLLMLLTERHGSVRGKGIHSTNWPEKL